MKNQRGKSVRFHFQPLCGLGSVNSFMRSISDQFLCRASKFSNFLSFPLLSEWFCKPFFFFFLVFFLLRSDQIASFKLKQIVVVLKCPMCISLLRDNDRGWLLNCGAIKAKDSFRELQVVNSLKVKYELRFKSKVILYHIDISGRCFFVCQLFAWIKAKE